MTRCRDLLGSGRYARKSNAREPLTLFGSFSSLRECVCVCALSCVCVARVGPRSWFRPSVRPLSQALPSSSPPPPSFFSPSPCSLSVLLFLAKTQKSHCYATPGPRHTTRLAPFRLSFPHAITLHPLLLIARALKWRERLAGTLKLFLVWNFGFAFPGTVSFGSGCARASQRAGETRTNSWLPPPPRLIDLS